MSLRILVIAAFCVLPAAWDAGGQQQPDAKLIQLARTLLARSPLIDGHNDYPWTLWENAKRDLDKLDIREPHSAEERDGTARRLERLIRRRI